MKVGQPEVGFATHLDRQYAAPQEDRADRVATYQAWVAPEHLLGLIILRGGWCLGEGHTGCAGVGCEWRSGSIACGLTKVYAITISATDMRKRATRTMTN